MITGVCLNPSFDKTVEVDALALGEVNRIRSVRVDMGGKGVNVAVVARRGDWKLMLFSCLPLAFCESCAMIEHVEARKGACRPCCAGFLRGIITRCFCKTGRNSACV